MIDIQSPDLVIVLLVCLSISCTISVSGTLFIESVATIVFTKVLSCNVNLDVLLLTHFREIKFHGPMR